MSIKNSVFASKNRRLNVTTAAARKNLTAVTTSTPWKFDSVSWWNLTAPGS